MKDLKDALLVIDMQNDFVTGALGSKEAQAIIPNVKERVQQYTQANKGIIFTKDTHYEESYLNSQEGQQLPIPHCIAYTEGWELIDGLIDNKIPHPIIINKIQFGSPTVAVSVASLLNVIPVLSTHQEFVVRRSLEVIGLDTDCCVLANVVMVRTMLPQVEVFINEECCAGSSPEMHQKALDVMKMYQVKVM